MSGEERWAESRRAGGPGRAASPGRDAEVLELLRTLSDRVARYHHQLAGQLQLHDTDLSAVLAVHELTSGGEGPVVGQLRQRLALSSPATTALVDRLVSSGHLTRVPDTLDRRRVRLRATERSYADVAPLLRGYLDRLDTTLAGFDAGELDVVRRFLTSTIEALEAASDLGGEPAAGTGRAEVPGREAPEPQAPGPEAPSRGGDGT